MRLAGDEIARGQLVRSGSRGDNASDIDRGQLGHRGSFPLLFLVVPGHVEADGLLNGSVLAVLGGVSLSIGSSFDGDGADELVAFLGHLAHLKGVGEQVHLHSAVLLAGDDVIRGDGGHCGSAKRSNEKLIFFGNDPLRVIPGHVEGDGLELGNMLHAGLLGVFLNIGSSFDGEGADELAVHHGHLAHLSGAFNQVHRNSLVNVAGAANVVLQRDQVLNGSLGDASDLDHRQFSHCGVNPLQAVPFHVEGNLLRKGSMFAVLGGVSLGILSSFNGDGADILAVFLGHIADLEGVPNQVHRLGTMVFAVDRVRHRDLGRGGSLGRSFLVSKGYAGEQADDHYQTEQSTEYTFFHLFPPFKIEKLLFLFTRLFPTRKLRIDAKKGPTYADHSCVRSPSSKAILYSILLMNYFIRKLPLCLPLQGRKKEVFFSKRLPFSVLT